MKQPTSVTQPAEGKKYDLDRVVRLVISIVGVVIGILIIDYLSPVLLPFVIGFILAYMLNPFVEFIRDRLHVRNRPLAVVIALVVVVATLIGAGYLIGPYLANEFSDMGHKLAAYARTSIDVPYVPDKVQNTIREWVSFEKIASMFSSEQWMKIGSEVATGTWSFLGGTLSVIMSLVSWLIVLLYMVFVLLDFDKLVEGFKKAIPKRYRRTTLRIADDVQQTMSRYFRGQALVSLFVGIIFAIEFSIIGLPMAIAFGLFVGVLNMIPYLQLISAPIAGFLCLVASVTTGDSFWVLCGQTFIAYCVCQLIQDLVLIPAIMKQQMGLNPAIVFLALSIWAYILGIIGLLIALPLTTLIISYYCEYVLNRPNPLHRGASQKNKKFALVKYRQNAKRTFAEDDDDNDAGDATDNNRSQD